MKFDKSIKKKYLEGCLITVLIAGFSLLAITAKRLTHLDVDIQISHAIQNISYPAFSLAMNSISWIGDGINFEIIVVLAMALLFFVGLKKEAIKTALLAAASATSGSLIKSFIDRPRPDATLVDVKAILNDKSFPSLHVMLFTAFFGYMFYLAIFKVKTAWIKTLIATASMILILSIGFSRIYLGAHWASDVLGGYILGAIFLFIAIKLSRRIPD